MFAPAYLDHNATTPIDAGVLAAMMPFLTGRFGNPSSRHEYGRAARAAIDAARQQVAALVSAHPTEVVFTSGGTEANNLFVKGAAACLKPGTIAVGATEHPCVLKPAEQLARQGWSLHRLPVDSAGRIPAEAVGEARAAGATLVSVMLANNETGVVQDLQAVGESLRGCGAWVHGDAVQACGKLAVDFRALNQAGVHALSLSAHKLYGPKGAGALIIDKRIEISPLLAGGGHERGLRSGTENVAAIVGFGAACELAASRLAEAVSLEVLRERLERGLVSLGASIFGAGAARLPNTSFFAFADIDGETLVGKLDRAGFACASGSACSSANPEPSHVLRAMGVAPELARGAVRVSFGHGNTVTEVDGFLAELRATLGSLQALASIAV